MAEILTDRKTPIAPVTPAVAPVMPVVQSAETSSDGAEAPKTPPVTTKAAPKRTPDFAFHVKPNRWFRIKGEYFGSGGTVMVGGQQAVTESWSTTEIEGRVPEGVNSGEVVVHVDDTVKKYGYFNAR